MKKEMGSYNFEATKKACLFGMMSSKRVSKRKFLNGVREKGALPDVSTFEEVEDKTLGIRDRESVDDDFSHSFRYRYSVYAIKVGKVLAKRQKSISIDRHYGEYSIDEDGKVIGIAREIN